MHGGGCNDVDSAIARFSGRTAVVLIPDVGKHLMSTEHGKAFPLIDAIVGHA